tara:strand:+ start:586 stop:744 length:159 start_codon:yes stop_codon:yes gene_type:complete
MSGRSLPKRCPKVIAKIERILNERKERLNSYPPLSDWVLNEIAELGFNGADY